MLRSLSNNERTRLLLSQNPDPILVQAVLEAPSFSSGITDETRARMLEFVVNRDHANDLAAIAEVEEALELLEAATRMVWTTAKSASEFPSEKTFSDFIDSSAPPATTSADFGDDRSTKLMNELGQIHAGIAADRKKESAGA
jgi:hypothetical protein